MLEERGDKHGADSALDKHVTDADGLAVTSAARRCEKFKDKLYFYFFCAGLFLGGLFALRVCPTIVKQFLAPSPGGTALIKNDGCSQEISGKCKNSRKQWEGRQAEL